MFPDHHSQKRFAPAFAHKALESLAPIHRWASEHAQPEIREVAQQMLKAVKEAGICPIAIKVLEENGWNI